MPCAVARETERRVQAREAQQKGSDRTVAKQERRPRTLGAHLKIWMGFGAVGQEFEARGDRQIGGVGRGGQAGGSDDVHSIGGAFGVLVARFELSEQACCTRPRLDARQNQRSAHRKLGLIIALHLRAKLGIEVFTQFTVARDGFEEGFKLKQAHRTPRGQG